jgi:hypothetical protein
MKFEIRSRYDPSKILYSAEAESFKLLVEAAIQARADLSGARLSGADLSGARLSGADLSGADLSWAELSGADLSRARLSGADLSWAKLSWAELSGANLSGADLSGASLSGASLSGAKGVDGYYCFGPCGSRNSYTWARWEGKEYMVHCGCKTLNLKDFAKAVVETHKDNHHAKMYLAHIEIMKMIADESKK